MTKCSVTSQLCSFHYILNDLGRFIVPSPGRWLPPTGENHCILPSAGVLKANSLMWHHSPAAFIVQLRCLMIRLFFHVFLFTRRHHIPPAGRREFRILMSTLYVPCIMHAQLAAAWRCVAMLPPPVRRGIWWRRAPPAITAPLCERTWKMDLQQICSAAVRVNSTHAEVAELRCEYPCALILRLRGCIPLCLLLALWTVHHLVHHTSCAAKEVLWGRVFAYDWWWLGPPALRRHELSKVHWSAVLNQLVVSGKGWSEDLNGRCETVNYYNNN